METQTKIYIFLKEGEIYSIVSNKNFLEIVVFDKDLEDVDPEVYENNKKELEKYQKVEQEEDLFEYVD